MAAHPIVNLDQASSWDGEEGNYWVVHEDRYNATLGEHAARLAQAARIVAGERTLDVGCGCGESTRAAARAGAPALALGVDLSANMLGCARERARAEGLANARFEQADAQAHPFESGAFDVIISRFGVMFFSDPTAAFRNLRRALRRGGRMTLLTWRGLQHNDWIREIRGVLAAGRTMPAPPPGAPGPLGLSDPDAVKRVLTDAGFTDIAMTESNAEMRFGRDRDDAFGFMSGFPMARDGLAELDAATRERTLENLRAILERHQTPDGVRFHSSAWVITAR